MQLGFQTNPGKVHISQFGYIKDLLETLQEKLLRSNVTVTSMSSDLFDRGGDGLLIEENQELFHTMVMIGLFIGKCSHPDILPATKVLSGENKNQQIQIGRSCIT